MDIRDNVIQANIKVAYDQTHDHTSISHKHRVSTKHTIKFNQKQERQRSKTLSLEAYDLYISPPLATSYQKVRKCIVICVSQAWSSGGGVERTPRMKASVDVARAGGVAAGGGTEAVAADADEVALISGTGTVADL